MGRRLRRRGGAGGGLHLVLVLAARRPTPAPTFAPLAEPVFTYELAAKRVYPADDDANVPIRPEDVELADFNEFKLSLREAHPKATKVGFIYQWHNVSGHDIIGLVGRLVLRDRHGRALYVRRVHFPGQWDNSPTGSPG